MAANKFIASLFSDFILKKGSAPESHLLSILRKGLDSEWRRIYNEQRFYQSAYLSALRKKLLPHLTSYPDDKQEEALMQQVYE